MFRFGKESFSNVWMGWTALKPFAVIAAPTCVFLITNVLLTFCCAWKDCTNLFGDCL